MCQDSTGQSIKCEITRVYRRRLYETLVQTVFCFVR